MTSSPEILSKLDHAYSNVAELAAHEIRLIQLLLKPEFLLIRVLNANTLKLLNLLLLLSEGGLVRNLPYREMSKILEVSLRTVTRGIGDLKSCNIITVTGNRHNLNYMINPSSKWTGIFEEQREKIELLKESGKFTLLTQLNNNDTRRET